MSQTSKIVLAIIITAIIVGGGVYFWQSQSPEQQNSKKDVTSQEAQLETFSLNQDGGFSFQHPANWKTESSSSPEIGSSKVAVSSPDWSHLEEGAEFLVWINPPGSGYEYLVNDLGSSEVYLDNVLATKNLASDESGNINAAILKFSKGENFYFVKYEFVAENEEKKESYFAVLDNILNSFEWSE